MALTNCREVPNFTGGPLVLEVAMDEQIQAARQVIHRVDIAVEFAVGGVIVNTDIGAVDAFNDGARRLAAAGDLAVNF